jgi:hypothetical protein
MELGDVLKNIGKRIWFFLQQEKEHGWRYDGFKDKREDKIRGVEWGLLQQDVSYVKKKTRCQLEVIYSYSIAL